MRTQEKTQSRKKKKKGKNKKAEEELGKFGFAAQNHTLRERVTVGMVE